MDWKDYFHKEVAPKPEPEQILWLETGSHTFSKNDQIKVMTVPNDEEWLVYAIDASAPSGDGEAAYFYIKVSATALREHVGVAAGMIFIFENTAVDGANPLYKVYPSPIPFPARSEVKFDAQFALTLTTVSVKLLVMRRKL